MCSARTGASDSASGTSWALRFFTGAKHSVLADQPHLPLNVDHLAEKIDVAQGQAERLTLPHTGTGAEVGQHRENTGRQRTGHRVHLDRAPKASPCALAPSAG